MRRAFVVMVVVGMMSVGGWGQNVPQKHIPYLKALGDLRTARAWLANWQNNESREADVKAIAEIDAAMEAIKHASLNDGRPLTSHPVVNEGLPPKERFKIAVDWIWKAHLDLQHAEDLQEERGLRERVLRRVDQAHYLVDSTWRTAKWQ